MLTKGETKGSIQSYQPGERKNQSTVKVGDILYMWGGFRTDFPEVHNGDQKKNESSVAEVCHFPTGRKDQKPTTGNPPLGIHGYTFTRIGNEIFYFGGDCNHQGSCHNSLHSFNVKTLRWKELSPTTSHHGPMMKRDAGMVAMRMYGEDYLVVIGGWGLSYGNTPGQPEAEYHGLDQVPDLQHCNEIHYYKLSSGAVTDTFYHSLSVWKISPDTYQIIEFGGGGQSSNTAVSQLNIGCNHNDWLIETIQRNFDLREKNSERQSEESSQQFKKQSLERELEEEEIRRREQTTIRLRKDLHEKEKQLRTTEESFWEVLHLVKDEKDSAQFEYLRLQLDGDVVIVKKNLFLPLDETSSFRWKKYGFRFQSPQGVVSRGTKMAVTVLVGGNFILPKGTELVSAVYAISVSKPLLKPLVIELHHCVDLRIDAQADCLKFVRAPLKSPYEFSLIDGGSFSVGRRYESIECDQFCLITIDAEMSNEESSTPSETGGSEEDNQEVIEGIVTEPASDEAMVGLAEATAETLLFNDQSTSIPQTEINRSDILYTGMMYHERRDTGYWITMYTAVKDLDAMLQYVENKHNNAERDVNTFKFNQGPNGIMKLTLGTPLEAGWIVHPHQEPMELRQSDMDSMQSPMVSTIQLSVYAVPGVATVPLYCPIELTGINPSKTIYINRPPPPLSTGSARTYNNASSHPTRENKESMNRRDIADAAMRECAETIRNVLHVLDVTTLLNKLVERRLINDSRRREFLDERSTNQRIDNFITLVKALVRNHDDAFQLFVEIIQEENTLINYRLAQTLIDTYTRLSSQY